MAQVESGSVARQLGSLFECGSMAGLSDRQLIERFNARRDADAASEAAFAALVARHGPMVLGVCRQLVADRQLAEDAFQAVFLVLARKARSIRDPDLLGNWLYGVALRTARYARLRLARLRQNEEVGTMSHSGPGVSIEPSVPPAEEAVMAREQAEALHGEIERLPDSFRLPVVLCYFEGLTIQEAALRLRWPHGTVRSRIARAREKLRRGLIRRGVVLPAAALAAVLDSRPARASVSSPLCDITARAAIRHADGALSAPAAALAEEVIRTALWHKVKATALSVLLLATLTTGAGYLSAQARSREGQPPGERRAKVASREGEPPGEPRANPARTEPRPPEPRTTVIGRVLDSQGKPLPNARLAALADRKRQVGDIDGRHRNIFMGAAAADADGRFTLGFPAIPAPRLDRLRLIAAAPGRGLGMVELKTDAASQEASIALAPEEPIEGRLVDVQGQPAAGVVVRVAALNFRPKLEPYEANAGPSLWPPPATTDATGRFRLLGLGADAPATFEIADQRFARQAFAFHAEGIAARKAQQVLRPSTTVTLQPAQALVFHVIHADDGRPVAGARVDIQSSGGRRSAYFGEVAGARTDGRGRARIVPWPGDRFMIRVYPPEGEPYLPASLNIDWPKAAVQHSVEAKLPRGVLVRGRLIEDPAGTPAAGGWIVYHQTRRGNSRPLRLPSIEAVSGPDGTFTLVVPHGAGHLLVQGPTADYLHVATSNVELGIALRPSLHLYPDAHAVLDIKDGEAPRPLDLRLRRGVTVAGVVVTPDGRPVAEAFAFGRSYVPYGERAYNMSVGNGTPPQIEVKGGRFEIPGCDPNKPGTFYFLDRKDRLGATVELSGQSAAGGPLTVRLRPTASASFVLKRADGKVPGFGAARNQLAGLRLIITPGPDWEEINKNIDVIPGDFAYQINLDETQEYPPRPGPDGRITLPNLIPGATYRFRGRKFTPEPGQTVDLGEIEVDTPRR